MHANSIILLALHSVKMTSQSLREKLCHDYSQKLITTYTWHNSTTLELATAVRLSCKNRWTRARESLCDCGRSRVFKLGQDISERFSATRLYKQTAFRWHSLYWRSIPQTCKRTLRRLNLLITEKLKAGLPFKGALIALPFVHNFERPENEEQYLPLELRPKQNEDWVQPNKKKAVQDKVICSNSNAERPTFNALDACGLLNTVSQL